MSTKKNNAKQVKKNTVKTVKAAKKPEAKKPEAKQVKKPVAKVEAKKPEVKKPIETKAEETKAAIVTDEERKAERKAYAAAYYAKNADKVREASRKSHAKRREAVKVAVEKLSAIFDAVCGLVSETGAEEFDHFYKEGGETMMNDFEDAVRVLGGKVNG